MQGANLTHGTYIDSFDIKGVQAAYDTWLQVCNYAPYSNIQYLFYHWEKLASVPVDAMAFAQRTRVSPFGAASA